MTPGARVQAAIDILDLVITAARDDGAAADTIIQRYFRDRRYAGSKDRRAVRELAYAAIRRTAERPSSGRAAILGLVEDRPELGALFDGSHHAPSPIQPEEEIAPAGYTPAWLSARLNHLGEKELKALLDRAPLDLRVNGLKADRAHVLEAIPDAVPCRLAVSGVRLTEPLTIERHPLFLEGAIEVQDEGSQLIVAACKAETCDLLVDLCAGAGGKTLGLAAAMGNQGRIIACDTDRNRLSRLAPRAGRAGASNIEIRLLDPGKEMDGLEDIKEAADLVLVDAPCSGTGTWRRNPEARWRLTSARLDRLTALQQRVLDVAAELVKPGGRLVYAVCSVLEGEGRTQVGRFIDRHAGWHVEPVLEEGGRRSGGGILLTPANDGTDGFFIASLKRTC